MWYPFFPPFPIDPNRHGSSDIRYPTSAMVHQMIPFDQRMHYTVNDALAEVGYLHRHPALEVARQQVYLKVSDQVRGHRLSITASDMSSKLNKSRRPSFYGVLQCVNCGTSCPSGATRCRRCKTLLSQPEESPCWTEEEKELGLLPNTVKEELNLQSSERSEVSPRRLLEQGAMQKPVSNSSITRGNLQRGREGSGVTNLGKGQLWDKRRWNEGYRITYFKEASVQGTAFKEPSAEASFSLDVELEMQSKTSRGPPSQPVLGQDPSLNDTDILDLEQETLPEYYSLNTTSLTASPGSWSGGSQTAEQGCSSSCLATRGSAEWSSMDLPRVSSEVTPYSGSISCLSNSSDWTDDIGDCYDGAANQDGLTCPSKVEEYHSVLEGGSLGSAGAPCDPGMAGQSTCEESFLSVGAGEAGLSGSAPQEPVCLHQPPHTVSQYVDASSDFRACFTSTRATDTISPPNMSVRDAAVGTDPTPGCRMWDATQATTAEKYTITEVYMSDLDILSEEFGRLQRVEVEFEQLKQKVARSGVSCAGESGAREDGQNQHQVRVSTQRARRAELRLLALQHILCQQHCWRRYYTSPQGEGALHRAELVPDAVTETLKVLEDDYQQLRRKVLAGVPLDELQPLSVDTERTCAGERYTPTQIYSLALEDAAGSHPPWKEGEKGPETQPENTAENISTSAENGLSDEAGHVLPKVASSRRRRAISLHSQQTGGSIENNARKKCPAKPGGAKDPSCEAWYDAEEELGPANQGSEVDPHNGGKEGGESRGTDGDQISLCVTNLSSEATEADVLLWFHKYGVTAASISTLSNNSRAAVVSLSCPKAAKQAVKDLNGSTVQDCRIYVEHIHKASAVRSGVREEEVIRPPGSHPIAPPAGLEVDDTECSRRKASNCPPKALCCSLEKLTNICDAPTARGTCVAQHYATMGSFDTLMVRLLERHPEAGRQRIVDALLELRAKHQGFLSGLPLRTIEDMTSDLLKRSSTPQ